MSEINVTPMVDVMLVLLIIFMVSAPLLTVGVPIDLPQTQAKSLDQDKEPLTVSVNTRARSSCRTPRSRSRNWCQAEGDHRGSRRHRRAHLRAWRQEGRLRHGDAGDGAAVGGGLSPRGAGDGGRAGLVNVMRMKTGHDHIVPWRTPWRWLWGLSSFAAKPLDAAAGRIACRSTSSPRPSSRRSLPASRPRRRRETPKPLVEKVGEPKPAEDRPPRSPTSRRSSPTARLRPSPSRTPAGAEARTADAEPKPSRSRSRRRRPRSRKSRSDRRGAEEGGGQEEAAEAEEGAASQADRRRRKKPKAKPQPKIRRAQVAALLDKREPQRRRRDRRHAQRHGRRSARPTGTPRNCRRASSMRCARGSASAGARRPGAPRTRSSYVVHPHQVQSRRLAGGRTAGRDDSASQRRVSGAVARAPCARCHACASRITMLRPEHYEQWKDIEIEFNPTSCSVADRDQRMSRNTMTITRSTSIARAHRAAALLAARRGASPARIDGCRPRFAAAVVQLDVSQGNFQPMPIALPDFVGGTAERWRDRRARSPRSSPANLRRSGLFAPIDPAAYHREDHQRRRRAALSRLARDQRAGAGHRPHDAAARRPAQSRVPAVGRVRRPAARRPAILHHAGQLAPHRPHHLRRDLRAAHRREGLFRHAASCSSTRPGRRSSASSGSPSWIRTAPTCAI